MQSTVTILAFFIVAFPMPALSSNLAVELAARLEAVVPANFSVRADGDQIGVYQGERLLGGSAAASIVDEEDERALSEKIAAASRAVLDAVQDCIIEELHEPWPRMVDGSLALPGSETDGRRVYFWRIVVSCGLYNLHRWRLRRFSLSPQCEPGVAIYFQLSLSIH
jgi:hypothetical protein